MKRSKTNFLINESSPYLLQHAHNPVNWYPWGDTAFIKAREENKPLLISIGYSSCHWCHVMERESFESEEVAQIMNENFICIKVDREEHPDVDQIYMSAVQLTSGRGGWPLNCIALPDGRPFFGGTYFPKEHWIAVLQQISDLYVSDRQKVIGAADQLASGIRQNEFIEKKDDTIKFIGVETLDKMVRRWGSSFDNTHGGTMGAPKFPLPNNYEFLLRYACNNNDDEILHHVELTLQQMAYGGIYDQIGGGFARYSTDEKWKIPHFEKMLYDNAQLVSLYSHAYQHFKNPLYKKVVEETLSFVKRELTSSEGFFFSALDADSEGVEGKYYVWTKEELKHELGDDTTLFFEYYRINKDAYWENDHYVLLHTEDAARLAEAHEMSLEKLHQKMGWLKEKLLSVRQQRTSPGLDDKILTSWNAMMICAYVDAYMALQDKSYLQTALKAALLIEKRVKKEDGGLYHTYKNGVAKINGLLDDYACTIASKLALYAATLDDNWLGQAIDLNNYVIKHFFDQKSGMFFYTSDENKVLVVRKKEVFDNVIPSSNSMMARNLKKLSFYTENSKFEEISRQMMINMADHLISHGSSFSNWALLMMDFLDRNYEVVICGEDALKKLRELQKHYTPNILWAGTTSENNHFSFLKSRFIEGKTYMYVCENNTCQLPTENVAIAKKMLGI